MCTRHEAQSLFSPSLMMCKTPVFCINHTVSRHCAKQIMIIIIAILCKSVGKKVITHLAFIIGPLTCNLMASTFWHRVVQTTGHIPPACPVFLLHTALITVGVSSLTACGAHSVHHPCGLRGAPNGRRAPHAKLRQTSPIHKRLHPPSRRRQGGVAGNMSPGIIAGLPLKDMFMSGE